MPGHSEEVRRKLRELQQNYLENLPLDIEAAETLIQTLRQTPEDTDTLADLYRLMHRLNGSGMTFGFPDVSEIASAAERDIQVIMDHDAGPEETQLDQIGATVHALKTRVAELAHPTTSDDEPVSEEAEDKAGARTIALVSRDAGIEDLVSQIQYFGYIVHTVSTLSDLETIPQGTALAALVLDMELPEELPDDWQAVSDTQAKYKKTLPLIFLSEEGNLTARLRAIRAGGNAYFVKPVDATALVDMLDKLTVRIPPEPYRILIIEDDLDLASYYSSTLEQAGMTTRHLQDPLDVMNPLEEFRPDLVLMDLYMPQCSGLELASVIRQQPAYISVPLVFLSTETNLKHHMTALHMGGDDFLTKPIAPEHLISAVTARVQRARTLRTLMVRDSLTGLLNHTTTVEHLYQEVARALRHEEALSYVMIDIDRFKSVNDTYGHPTGDRVLKNLARLLQQRLRQTDIIGRYGGEEFAVILLGTEGSQAVDVMEEIREQFSQVRQQSSDKEFYVTLSCGIASLSEYTDPALLSDAADKALYKAKNGGRNRVVLADGTAG